MELPKLKKINNINNKKKILLLSDDLRLHSGIGSASREFVLGTLHKYNWAQLAGAMIHPDKGKIYDLSAEATKETGVQDAYLKLYPVDGYGNADILREVIELEKPDAILHFTDPRFWVWLYQIAHEIRSNIPLLYLNIWDSIPDPIFNENFYESCDLLMAISKQTYGINKRVRKRLPLKDWQLKYVPHGINEYYFKPIDEQDNIFKDIYKKIIGNIKYDFIIFWNNRNIRRKMPGDVVLAYKTFCDKLSKEKASKCLLLMHTPKIDDNGTNLEEVVINCCPEYKVIFSENKLLPNELNALYNIADVTINIASNEGFGLSGAESIMAGTPIINNVTGGLQDQCGFSKNGKYLTAEDYINIKSLHDKSDEWAKKDGMWDKYGEWAYPVFPSNLSLQGSPPTPYIFDDRCSYKDVAIGIDFWYRMSRVQRKQMGSKGREYALTSGVDLSAKLMSDLMIDAIEGTFKNWQPIEKFEVIGI